MAHGAATLRFSVAWTDVCWVYVFFVVSLSISGTLVPNFQRILGSFTGWLPRDLHPEQGRARVAL